MIKGKAYYMRETKVSIKNFARDTNSKGSYHLRKHFNQAEKNNLSN